MSCIYDDLKSKWSQKELLHRKRYKLIKAAMRIQFKIRNLIDDLHKKMVKWLCVNHRMVLLPSFETSQLLRKGQRRIGNKKARAMATWGHYRFKMSILHLSQENIHGASQSYVMNISQERHVDNVGFIHDKLADSKTFKCPTMCQFTLERETNMLPETF